MILNSLFFFYGIPILLQLRWLNLSLFWENMPNCPMDDNFLYPYSVTSLLPSVWFLMVFLEFCSLVFASFTQRCRMESGLPSTHFPIGRKSICFLCCISIFYFHQREDWVTSSVLKMMIVSTVTCSVQALCGFCGYCSTGKLARVAMTDCPVVKRRRRVLFLCGRESSYTGGKGMGFL